MLILWTPLNKHRGVGPLHTQIRLGPTQLHRDKAVISPLENWLLTNHVADRLLMYLIIWEDLCLYYNTPPFFFLAFSSCYII